MCWMNIWLLPEHCGGAEFVSRTREITRFEPTRIDVVVDSSRTKQLPLAYSVSGGCDCSSFIGSRSPASADDSRRESPDMSPEEALAWIGYLEELLPRKSRIGLIRTWSPGDRVTPASAASVPREQVDEPFLRGLQEEKLLLIRFGDR